MIDPGDAGYKNLAAAVIRQAVVDADRPLFGKREWVPNSYAVKRVRRIKVHRPTHAAIHFLTVPSEGLSFWCRVSGMDMRRLLATCQARYRLALGRLAALEARSLTHFAA